jgi:hypothetical protein
MADFTPGKQTLLRQAISRAAAVPLSKVLVKFQPVARRRFHFGIPHTPHTGLMPSLESGVGRRLLADYIKVDVQMAAADTNGAQAAIDKLTPKRINQELLNAGLPAAQVLVSAQVFYTPPPSTPPPEGILLDSYTMHLSLLQVLSFALHSILTSLSFSFFPLSLHMPTDMCCFY